MTAYPDVLRPGDHLNFAQDFYRAFHAIPRDHPPRSWPRYFMLCHAAELALKAYLFSQGAKPKELRAHDVRHSLKELLKRATSKGLSLSAKAQTDIGLLDQAHKEFWNRYPKEDWTAPVYVIEQFEPAVGELLEQVRIGLYGKAASLAKTAPVTATRGRSRP
jgi:hypothetical protein